MDQFTITIHPTGDVFRSDWPDAGQLLQHLYQQMNCSLVAPVSLGEHLTLWCDEEAFMDEPNALATKLCGLFGPLNSYLAGIVVLTGPGDSQGRTQPLNGEAAEHLRRVLSRLQHRPWPAIGSTLEGI